MRKEVPSAPQMYPSLPQVEETDPAMQFRMTQISKIRDFLESEAETRTRLRRRYKACYNTAHYVNIGSNLTAVASSTAAAISLSTGIGALAALPLGIVALTTGVVGITSSGIGKIVLKKTEKHERIKQVATSKLSSVNDLVSKALLDGKISDVEFQVIQNERESYRDLKSQIRTKLRTKLSSDREEKIREEAEKKGRQTAMNDLQNIMKQSG